MHLKKPATRLIARIGGWLVPYKAVLYWKYRADIRAKEKLDSLTARDRALATGNAGLKDRFGGKRCFLLCNGPTVKKQNLLPLADETVISVSNGYHHPDFAKFRPRFHCVPQLTYGQLTEQDAVAWFTEMHAHLGDAELFLSTTEEPLVSRYGLFSGRRVHYVFLHESFDEIMDHQIPDLAAPAPRVESVAIMGTMIAMYLGFSDIYLLGTEHDQFKTGHYTYFFERGALQQKDPDVTPEGKVTTPHYDEFHQLVRLWKQYRALKEIAAANNIRIWNATAGGELDEFPRVRLESIVGQAEASP